jgi:hypothetical protein
MDMTRQARGAGKRLSALVPFAGRSADVGHTVSYVLVGLLALAVAASLPLALVSLVDDLQRRHERLSYRTTASAVQDAELIINAGALVLCVWGIRAVLLGTELTFMAGVDLALIGVILFLLTIRGSPRRRIPAGSGPRDGPEEDLDQIEKGPSRPFRRSSGGPEGNRTPDLFHAKDEIGGSPSSAQTADFASVRYRKPVGGFLEGWHHSSLALAYQARRRLMPERDYSAPVHAACNSHAVHLGCTLGFTRLWHPGSPRPMPATIVDRHPTILDPRC